MRNYILPLIASVACATPALANDTRVEVRGGAIWSNGTTEATYGAAAGVDFDLAPMTFAGVEVSADKIDKSGTKLAYGVTARFGVKAGPLSKLFVAGGYLMLWRAGVGWCRRDTDERRPRAVAASPLFIGGDPQADDVVAGSERLEFSVRNGHSGK